MSPSEPLPLGYLAVDWPGKDLNLHMSLVKRTTSFTTIFQLELVLLNLFT